MGQIVRVSVLLGVLTGCAHRDGAPTGSDTDADSDTDVDTSTPDTVDTATLSCPVPYQPAPSPRNCSVRWTYDAYDDGRIDSTELWVYGPHPEPIYRGFDWDADGVDDQSVVMTYDDQDRLLTAANDYDNDGVVDALQTMTYDETGLVLVVQEDPYGNVVRIDVTSGPCGMTSLTYDDGDDGTVDGRIRITYTRTSMTTETDWAPVDGVFDDVSVQEYDEATGRPTHFEEDWDPGHPGPESLSDTLYDAVQGYRTRVHQQYWDGSLLRPSDYVYGQDADGREDSEVYTDDTFVAVRRADWACP
ncbi:MAG: hypothetical protein R3F59_18700 [Myxococcota bacterium]